MREQRVDAGFGLGWIEDELGFAVFLRNGVVVADGYRSVGAAVEGDANVEDREVYAKGEDGRSQDAEQRSAEDSAQPFPEVGRGMSGHDAEL